MEIQALTATERAALGILYAAGATGIRHDAIAVALLGPSADPLDWFAWWLLLRSMVRRRPELVESYGVRVLGQPTVDYFSLTPAGMLAYRARPGAADR
jgi:hypothetical protein